MTPLELLADACEKASAAIMKSDFHDAEILTNWVFDSTVEPAREVLSERGIASLNRRVSEIRECAQRVQSEFQESVDRGNRGIPKPFGKTFFHHLNRFGTLFFLLAKWARTQPLYDAQENKSVEDIENATPQRVGREEAELMSLAILQTQDRPNLSEVAKKVGVSVTTLRGWPKVLEAYNKKQYEAEAAKRRLKSRLRKGDVDADE